MEALEGPLAFNAGRCYQDEIPVAQMRFGREVERGRKRDRIFKCR